MLSQPPDAASSRKPHSARQPKLARKCEASPKPSTVSLRSSTYIASHGNAIREACQQVCHPRGAPLAKHVVLALLSDDGPYVEAVVTSGVDPISLRLSATGSRSGVLSQLLERRAVRRRDVNGIDAGRSTCIRAVFVPSVPVRRRPGLWIGSASAQVGRRRYRTDERMAVLLPARRAWPGTHAMSRDSSMGRRRASSRGRMVRAGCRAHNARRPSTRDVWSGR